MERIMRYTLLERLCHGAVAVSFVILALTGMGLYSKRLTFLLSIFGDPKTGKEVHNITGFVFMASVGLMVILFVREMAEMTGDDWLWLKRGGGYLSKGPVELPEQGRFNAGQKVLFYLVLVCAVVLAVSGLIMMYPLSFSKSLVQATYPIHELFAVLAIIFIIGHVYLGTLANPKTWQAMVTGMVDGDWARFHHPRWYRQLVGERSVEE